MSDTIATGTHWVDAPCPRCGSIELLAVSVSVVLQVPTDDAPSLRLRCKSKAVDHSCGQTTISLRNMAGALFTPDPDDD